MASHFPVQATPNARTRLGTGVLSSFLIFIAGYVVLILISPHLGPVDDHELLATIQVGRPMPLFIYPSIGRFYVLDGQILNLVSRFSTDPLVYYVVNAVELLLLTFFFCDMTRRIAGRGAALGALLVLLLAPGFVTAWLRLLVPERESLLCFVLFLWCFSRYAEHRSPVHFIGAVLAANLALYYKEPSFVMVGAFATLRLVGPRLRLKPGSNSGHSETRALDVALLCSALIYLLIYYFVIYRHHGTELYGGAQTRPLFDMVKNLVSYATGDPVLMFLALPLGLWRLVVVLSGRCAFEPFADPLLFGALSYMSVYVALNMFAPHYWLPAYAFALPALLSRWRQRTPDERFLWIGGGGIAAFFLATVAIPSALYLASYYKYVPRNFAAAVVELSQRVAAQPAHKRAHIYLDGIEPGPGLEMFVGLRRYLTAAGLSLDRFELLPADMPREGAVANWVSPQSGDYLVVTPFTSKNTDDAYRTSLLTGYRLAWESRSPYALPNFQLRILLKYIALRYLLPSGSTEVGGNFSYRVDYAIYVKR